MKAKLLHEQGGEDLGGRLRRGRRNWLPGKKVVVAPEWVEEVSWSDSKVVVSLTREQIEHAPEYDPSRPLEREHELRLYEHYGRPTYWDREDREDRDRAA